MFSLTGVGEDGAYYRVGEEKKAWRLWRQAVKLQPGFEMAQEALADRHKPVGQRSVPWYWTVAQWLPRQSQEEFAQIARRGKREERLRRDMQAWLDKHPAVWKSTRSIYQMAVA